MACRLDSPAADALWASLLACREFLGSAAGDSCARVYFARPDGEWQFFAEDPGTTEVVTAAAADATVEAAAAIEPQFTTLFRLYLPLLLGGHAARRSNGVFVTAHVAQTLDGRIACENGQSQWISNQANLVHSHRLRALHDAVLVGGRTVAADDPQLTVRHVAGRDPERVVLSASGSVLRSDGDRHVFRDHGCTVVCRTGAATERANARVVEATTVGDTIPPAAIGELLAQRGLHSVFLEGGSATLSSFLQHGAIDLLHVHVAPLILGSGVSSFSLPEVTHVREGRHLRMEHFEMDGELLFQCRSVNGS